jgi:hypothetical protein
MLKTEDTVTHSTLEWQKIQQVARRFTAVLACKLLGGRGNDLGNRDKRRKEQETER